MNRIMVDRLARIRERMLRTSRQAVVIGRQDNFAWVTGGMSNCVVQTMEQGFGYLVITENELSLVAHTMDGQRILDEELSGVDVKFVPLHWYDASREERTAELVQGKQTLSDISLPGIDPNAAEISHMHYPLDDTEIARYKVIGGEADRLLFAAADWIEPGMSERTIANHLSAQYSDAGWIVDVALVGADERISAYRHPLPSRKRLEKTSLLQVAAHKFGLHVNITRFVHFGDEVPRELRSRYDAANEIAAMAISMSTPGRSFAEILREQKRKYGETGYPDEWRLHFQGGVTGYMLVDPTWSLDDDSAVTDNMAFDWFTTITGAKVEELTLSTGGAVEVASASGVWPLKEYSAGSGRVLLPDILLREK